ncbi:MAG: GAF domain-containing protein, partial [Nitrospinae bacterium]|nr:GAF domain-containing protein [Nitrospinota bacterium]
MPELKNELERLKSEIEKKDAELQLLKSEREERQKAMDDERRAMMYMLEDANESITEMESAKKRLEGEVEVNTHLLMIAEAMANITDIDKLISQVLECSHEITGCDICLAYLWDDKRDIYIPNSSIGLPYAILPIFRTSQIKYDTEILIKAFANRVPIIEEVSNEGSVLFPYIQGINTISIIPLSGRKDFLGFISGIYRKKPEITKKDMKVMEGISNQVSTALEQARLYRESIDNAMELSHKVETIQVMNDIDRSILSSLRSTEMLDTAIMMIGRLIACDRATIAMVDKEKNGFIYSAGFGINIVQKETVVPFESTSTTDVIKTGRHQYMANLREIKGLLPLEERLLKEGFLSHVRIPLVAKNEIVGVLNLGSKRPSAFTPEDLSTLEKLAYQIGVALEKTRLITDLNELFMGTVKSLSSAIDAKSRWTAGHSERVTKYSVEIGKGIELSEKELRDLELSGLLHDIGKIGTYEAILDKAGKLTDEEYKIVKEHPAKGAEILLSIKQMKDIIPGVKHHHEFYNGKGYPDGLKGEGIPLMARILCIADSVDAMGADRPYRKG